MSSLRSNSDGQIQYIADTFLLEKIFSMGDAMDRLNGINKQADFGGFLSGVAQTIMDWAKSHVDTSSISSTLLSLTDLLVPGVLFKIHPALGVLEIIGQSIGFSTTDIIRKILSFLSGKLQAGIAPTLEEINNVGKGALAASAGAIEATASDPLSYLRTAEAQGRVFELVRGGQLGFNSKNYPTIPFLPDSKAPLLTRVFGNLLATRRTGKAKWLLGGFVIWIVKTILLGAGLVAGGEVIKGLLTGGKDKPTQVDTESQSGVTEESDSSGYQFANIVTPSPQYKPSGRGQEFHKNDGQSIWIVPLLGGDVARTLWAWAVDVYPELEGKEQEMMSSASFNKMVKEMQENFKPGDREVMVPNRYKTRKQVVDQFV